MKSHFKAAFLAFTLLATPAFADPIPEPERAAIAKSVAAFDAAFRAGNMGVVFDYMPDRIITGLVGQSGLGEAEFEAMMQEQLDLAFETVTVDDFGMDIANATWQQTPDGSLSYALIPTVTLMTVEGMGKMRADGETLAFAENGTWYLVRIDEPGQAEMLATYYPAFKGVAFKPGSMQAVE